MTEFYVKVEPGSDKFQIEEGSILKVFLTAPAENGRANAELIAKLSEILGRKPGIVSGHHSRRKKLRVDLPEEEVEEKLESFF